LLALSLATVTTWALGEARTGHSVAIAPQRRPSGTIQGAHLERRDDNVGVIDFQQIERFVLAVQHAHLIDARIAQQIEDDLAFELVRFDDANGPVLSVHSPRAPPCTKA
jgi:hypothetical protein